MQIIGNNITNKERIKTHLLFYGITEHVEIEDEAEEMILQALESDDIEQVSIDDEGGLLIEYKDDVPNNNMDQE